MSSPRKLVNTATLARELGLSTRTIQAYRQHGILVPEIVSAGGHARWDVEKVKATLREIQQRRAQEERDRP